MLVVCHSLSSWLCKLAVTLLCMCKINKINFVPVACKRYILQGVWLASLAYSLLVHRFHLCIYCMEGYCVHGTSVPVCSMNNKQWFKDQVYSKLQASLCCIYTCAQSRSRDLTSLTT